MYDSCNFIKYFNIMKKIIYFIEFIIVYFLFIIFKLLGYKISSNLGYLIGKFCGPIFRSKKSIIENLILDAVEGYLTVINYEKSLEATKKNYDAVLKAIEEIKTKFDSFLDHSGAIGRRYRRLDEIGAPFAITIDHQTKDDNTVTIRSRDSMSQDRVKIADLEAILSKETKFP